MKLRFVKFFTSRENEIERKEGGGCHCVLCHLPNQAAASASLLLPLLFSFPLIISILSSFTRSTNLPPPPPQLVSRHVPPSSCPSYPSPSCSASPFLLHKITETAERGGCYVAGAQLANPAVTGRAQLAAPLLLHPIGWPQFLSGSNGTLSVAGGAIGKQSMKMNYPVPSPSLTNK